MGYTMEKDSFNSFFGVAKIVILSNLYGAQNETYIED